MPRRPIPWAASPHTLAKISILQNYLGAWIPILGKLGGLNIIDGFSGPGEYWSVNGGPRPKGSPIVAMETALYHKNYPAGHRLYFCFVDQDKRCTEHLAGLVGAYNLPPHIVVDIVNGTFEDVVAGLLDDMKAEGRMLAPTFVLIDPCGVKGVPMALVHRILQIPRSEVMVNLMTSAMVRFATRPEFAPHLDALFGCQDWRAYIGLPEEELDWALADLYQRQLPPTIFSRLFRMRDRKHRPLYDLVFATRHELGVAKMKEAMWRVSPTIEYEFSDAYAGQLTIFGSPDLSGLRMGLTSELRGRTLSIEQLTRHVVLKTPYLSSHLRKSALIPMEDASAIRIVSPRKRAHSYPDGTMIHFL